MKIVDIVNRDHVNLTNCESEPIHIPGSIQPHGFLLAINPHTGIIQFCSNNVTSYLQVTPQQVLQQPLNTFFSNEEIGCLYNRPQAEEGDVTHPCVFTYDNIKYNTTVYTSGDLLVLEFEPFPDGSLALPDLYTQTKKFVSFLDRSTSLQQLCHGIAEETRRITGYDRVMIYRFDKDYNGEIFAESKREDLQPFLGLNYPHTDIPVQARQLYLKNLMRMITDVTYEPVPLLTTETTVEKTLDLSHSVLRSVSPIHIEYLKNMGVGATLTISLIQDKKLWGLIACHHYAPKNIPHYTRLAALLQGHFLTSQIKVRELADEHALGQVIDSRLQQLLDQLSAPGDANFTSGLDSPLLRQITNADGVAIMHDSQMYTNGTVPDASAITQLAETLSVQTRNGTLNTSRLTDVYANAANISDTAAGIIFHQLGNNDFIIWFRQEADKSINWAGNPDKAIVTDDSNLQRLSPRKSFELWKQVVKLQSRDWHQAELNAADSFAFFLQRQFGMIKSGKEEQKYRELSEKLQAANEELANINWISTHDLKEPLRKIQIFASRILENTEAAIPAFVQDYVSRMRLSASRMQLLIDDLLSYSRINNNENNFAWVDLEAEIKTITDTLTEEIAEARVQVTTTAVPKIYAIPFQIRQLFLNLISNAVKFSNPQAVATIHIHAETIHHHPLMPGVAMHKIQVADNGIGFDNAHKNRIFEVFQRLHGSADKYTGTGIGLAICKKVMDNHNGFIEADGKDGEGAIFTVYFPVHSK